MDTTRSAQPPSPRRDSSTWAGLRRIWSAQLGLWNRMVEDLQPWRAEGPLRWQGKRLDGALLVDRGRARALRRRDHTTG